MPTWLLILLLVGIFVCFAVMPWARRFDKRIADRREAEGKPRSIVPNWVVVCIALVAVAAGIVIYNI